MPKDKRTRAYKDWLKREKQRERMKELEGAVSLRGFTYSDADAQEKYASLSMMLAELRDKLITDNSTEIEISEGRTDSSDTLEMPSLFARILNMSRFYKLGLSKRIQ